MTEQKTENNSAKWSEGVRCVEGVCGMWRGV
jgi:hypothetical protein